MANTYLRVGVGGWNFEGWRDDFYPAGWPQARELEYMSRQLTAIEINSTYYSSQKPQTFAKWRDETPDDFMFSLKASRFATNRRVLAEAGESVTFFVEQGISELKHKLGPIVWQFAPTKQFNAEDFGAFLELLPRAIDGLPLRHVMEVRHASFKCSEYLALARKHNAATVFADSDDYPSFADLTADFAYARLMRTQPTVKTGYTPQALDQWVERGKLWGCGSEPDDLPRVEPVGPKVPHSRDVFLFFISGAKERNPAAARALIERLK